jgi:LonC protease-like protein
VATSREWESRESPPDWVYVNNFVNATKPVAIELSAGQAPKFNHAMRGLIEDLKTALPAVFQSEDYQRRRGGGMRDRRFDIECVGHAWRRWGTRRIWSRRGSLEAAICSKRRPVIVVPLIQK